MPAELLVSRRGDQTWAALREAGRTVELRVESDQAGPRVGRIFKARVSKVLPGIQCAFLDLGSERQGFLHVRDLLLPGEQPGPPPGPEEWTEYVDLALDPRTSREAAADSVDSTRPAEPRGLIEDRLRAGRELLVQISRESLGDKGPRATCYLSLAGNLLVLFPQLGRCGVSRKIEDPQERERLLGILRRLAGKTVGHVARTAARGVDEAALRADAEELESHWKEIQSRAERLPAPSTLHREPDFILRLLRDRPREGLERILLDDPGQRRRAEEFLAEAEPQLAGRVALHDGPDPLFETYGVTQEIEKALRPRVWLKSGGYVVIEETEALVSIDVNTGKFIGGRRQEETVLRTNLEAAGEIARQLRLRDLGGIIVIDFIDMDLAESRNQVIAKLRDGLRHDPARTAIVGLSALGLLQLTRKRTRAGLGARISRACPLCAGQGRIKSAATVAAEALVELLQRAARSPERRFSLCVHPDSAYEMRKALSRAAEQIPADRIVLSVDPTLRPDAFRLNGRG